MLRDEIEPLCTVLEERGRSYDEFKRLVRTYDVKGRQVHDARLVAMMIANDIANIVTLNERDFRRYKAEGITVVTPSSLTHES